MKNTSEDAFLKMTSKIANAERKKRPMIDQFLGRDNGGKIADLIEEIERRKK